METLARQTQIKHIPHLLHSPYLTMAAYDGAAMHAAERHASVAQAYNRAAAAAAERATATRHTICCANCRDVFMCYDMYKLPSAEPRAVCPSCLQTIMVETNHPLCPPVEWREHIRRAALHVPHGRRCCMCCMCILERLCGMPMPADARIGNQLLLTAKTTPLIWRTKTYMRPPGVTSLLPSGVQKPIPTTCRASYEWNVLVKALRGFQLCNRHKNVLEAFFDVSNRWDFTAGSRVKSSATTCLLVTAARIYRLDSPALMYGLDNVNADSPTPVWSAFEQRMLEAMITRDMYEHQEHHLDRTLDEADKHALEEVCGLAAAGSS